MVDPLKEWSYDNVYECTDCGQLFAVLTEDGMLTNFCPCCASRNIDEVEEGDK